MNNDRKAWIAAVLGLVYPGLGHLYAGRLRFAVALMAGVPLLLAPIILAAVIHLPQPLNVATLWGGVAGVLLLGSVGGALAARGAPRPFVPGPANRWEVHLSVVLVGAFILSPVTLSLLRRYIGQAFSYPSRAMEPTILAGDRLFVDRNTRPSPGDIVAFLSTEEPGVTVIKRAVAVGGDTVEMRAGQLFRNGQVVVESYTASTNLTVTASARWLRQMRAWQLPHLARDPVGYMPNMWTWGPIIIPSNTFLDLGDNRDNSYDGRFYGPVPVSNIVGRARTVYYSFDPSSYHIVPEVMSIRWDRLGYVPR